MLKNAKLEKSQSIIAIACANFDSWIRSPRTVIMLLFVVSICYLQMCGYEMTLMETGYAVHLPETLFYEFNFGCNMPMTSILFLIMVSEIPQRSVYQQYTLIRSSRGKWLAAQLLYCLMMVLSMMLLILICIMIMALPLVSQGTGWSDTVRIASGQIQPNEALISEFIRHNFTPVQALLLANVPIFCFWFSMVLVILLCSLCGAPVAGVMAYAVLLVANVTILFEVFPFQMVLPMHYATLRSIVAGADGEELSTLVKVITVYMAVTTSLVLAMIAKVRHAELHFNSDIRQ